MIDEAAIGDKFRALAAELNERQRRLWAASEARSVGWGGITATARATGISIPTIRKGIAELESGERLDPGRVRRLGGGRKSLLESDPTILDDIERLVDEDSRGDPESLLRWTAKSVRQVAGALREMGHEVHFTSVATFMRLLGYSLQASVKTKEGASHPDRDAQFQHINRTAKAAVAAGWPVISVDCKKKELVGDFKNPGREWRLKGKPELVRVHDFKDKQLGKAIPYGVYDLRLDEGYVNVGIDHETAQFAVASIRSWWEHLGHERYRHAPRLTLTADCGGSNGNRPRLWKMELQKLADETELEIEVCHFPPGTSKWNQIEHRLFSFITMNRRGKPLVSLETMINLIAGTTTSTGLEIYARLDDGSYPAKIRVTNAELKTINVHRHEFHPEWNYLIKPHGH
ncbi:MAG TPA: ISAzo13 family transposase [Solirubrobacteraceae bacterium]|nr:ISAzo13 family transposase [Solirubrobacteraceae bacterium]